MAAGAAPGADAPPGPPGPDRGRLVVTDARGAIREHVLARARTSIGRHAGNDLVIPDDKAVSGRHAVVTVEGGVATVEDFESTNGTAVNGREIRRHALADGDAIGVGGHTLVYRAPGRPAAGAEAPRPALVAGFVVVDGPGAGQRVVLDRALTRVGRPGTQVAAVTARLDGYYIARVTGTEGATARLSLPTLNGEPFGTVAVRLSPGDRVVIGSTTLVFEHPLRPDGVVTALA